MKLSEKSGEAAGVLLAVFFILAVVPIAIIWSLNTLFPALAIAYSFWTWLAVLVLSLSTTNRVVKK